VNRKVFIETYGCQMNVADTEVILGILTKEGYTPAEKPEDAGLILVNTCSVREHAEQRVLGRLGELRRIKRQQPGVLVGLLGCMAERLRGSALEQEPVIDLVVGPDEYRKLPELIDRAFAGEKGIAVRLSRVENYEDIVPFRADGVSAWISVMRGCDKFCSFCIVPFTRGRERSRSLDGVVKEVESLSARGFKEVTLLGQNVNSYSDGEHDFADLLAAAARVDSTMRIRFTTSHPQDLSGKLISTIASHENICSCIHLPVQSGSNRILGLMNRTYTREHYLSLVSAIRREIPGVALSTDIIAGFPTETDEDHRMTLDLLREVRFDGAFMFNYSPREGTPSYRMSDDVPAETKTRRLNEIISIQKDISLENNRALIGSTVTVLVDGESKRSADYVMGRTGTNKIVIFARGSNKPGSCVPVTIHGASPATLFGNPASEFSADHEAMSA